MKRVIKKDTPAHAIMYGAFSIPNTTKHTANIVPCIKNNPIPKLYGI